MRFRWDPRKAEINRKKHRVSFEEATTAFLDPLAQIELDEAGGDGDEYRWSLRGLSSRQRLIVVIYVERPGSVVRIISAREATSHERKAFEQNQSGTEH